MSTIPVVTSPAPRNAWRELCESSSSSLLTQSPAWSDAITSCTRLVDRSRHYRFPGGQEMVLPIVGSRRPIRVGGSLASMPASWGFGGLVAQGAITPTMTRAVWDDLARLGPLRFSMRPNPLDDDVWDRTRPASVTREARHAHVLDLDGGFEAVWNDRFRSGTRRNMRKAEKAGLEVREGSDAAQLLAFHELFMLSVRRWADNQHEPARLAEFRARHRDPLEKFAAIAAACGEGFRLWVARLDDRPVAAIIVLQAGGTAHYTRGAMDQERAGPTRANDLLHRRAIEAACASGCRSYHMGETGRSESLARFKERFGAVGVDYGEYYRERLPLRRADQTARRVVKRLIGFEDA